MRAGSPRRRGVGGGAFAPNGKMTRAMVMTALARMDGADTSNGEHWYSAGLEWAVETGIMEGCDGLFNPTDTAHKSGSSADAFALYS